MTESTGVQLGANGSVERPELRPRREIPADKVLGLDGKLRPRVRVDTTDRDSRIRTMRARGDSIRQIAEAMGASVGTVHRVVKAASMDAPELGARRSVCLRWQDVRLDGRGGQRLVFSCECDGVGCPNEPQPAVVHQAPRSRDAGFTPCCGRLLFELPRSDRLAVDWERVTCARTS